jgi:phage I-like protein
MDHAIPVNPSIVCVALNAAASPGGGGASSPELAFVLGAELALGAEGQAPNWVELLPAGDPLVSPRDGRKWSNPNPAAVLAETMTRGLLPLAVDLDHASEMDAVQRQGQSAPAAGWIEELSLRNGAIWGRVVWTTRGAALVGSREYRYLSPAFAITGDERRVLFISSAALVNKPAFPQLALNSASHEDTMDEKERKALCAALGLAETATGAQITASAQKLKTEHTTALAAAQTPPLNLFVPRADHDAVVAKAAAAESKLAEHVKAGLEAEIEVEISKALEAKKITPGTAGYYRAMCAQEGGLDKFKEFVGKAPALVPDQMVTGDPGRGGAGTLTPEERAVCSATGVSEKDFLLAKGAAA